MLAATEMQKKPATVLCIDDEQTALQIRQSLLESAGYNVLAAKSGKQGINTFRSSAVQAVVLDYWMADMNGMQVAREIDRACEAREFCEVCHASQDCAARREGNPACEVRRDRQDGGNDACKQTRARNKAGEPVAATAETDPASHRGCVG